MFEVFTLIVAVSALLSYANHKLLKLPPTIGVLILSIVVSLLLGSLKIINIDWFNQACSIVTTIDFRTILFDFLLSFLLFAGAIHVNLKRLVNEKSSVMLLATLGVLVSTFIIGSLFFGLVQLFDLEITFIQCLIFGALISPTDPVAVLSLLQKANVNKKLEIKIIGESLFNDGVGIVVFLSILAIAGGSGHGHSGEIGVSSIAETFIMEAGGGMLLGFLLGLLGQYFLKAIKDEPVIEVHITLGIVMAGYSLASIIGVSGALAMVVAGIIIGNRLSKPDIPESVKNNLNTFWQIIDEVLNAILFVLIGLEILVLGFDLNYTVLGLLAIPLVVLARYISVFLNNLITPQEHRSDRKGLIILTWAGLRGGISIALALTLTNNLNREPILYITYMVVLFSIIVQGLTVGKVVKNLNA
ncbi:MAG: sodium:proton antiporter [Ekhidna sp.]